MVDPRTHLADGRPRGRGLGLPFQGTCGAGNALTDVSGVTVGYTTLIRGDGGLEVGRGPVRTGVTAILPRGPASPVHPVFAGICSLNGNGELTGSHWIRESGELRGPILITNTHSVGICHQAAARWIVEQTGGRPGGYVWALPVVAETCDAHLNDINGFHVTEADARAAIRNAVPGPLAEGNVGGGTGMICYEFKGGTGTASRVIELAGRRYTIGVLVQANMGLRPWLTVLGVPIGRHLVSDRLRTGDQGSIIAVVGTDLPLMPLQLQRLARRIGLGVGRTGTPSGDGSGDIFLAFSTANRPADDGEAPASLDYIANARLDPAFVAVVEAVEEAIINALIAAETMAGRDGHRVVALDHRALLAVMRRHGRIAGDP